MKVYKGASVSIEPTKNRTETILNLRNKYARRIKGGN